MQVIPVAGLDSMLLNLSGAHGPFFTRNLVILKDNSGRIGAGEVPGGEKIRRTLEESKPFVLAKAIGDYNAILNSIREPLATGMPGGAASKPMICGRRFMLSRPLKARCWICLGNFSPFRFAPCWVKAGNENPYRLSRICFTSRTGKKLICPIAVIPVPRRLAAIAR